MASVEDIYRKIRRGETHNLRMTKPTDAELSAGVERIRTRLARASVEPTRRIPRAEQYEHLAPAESRFRGIWLWLPGAAVAAAAIVTFMVMKPTTPPADAWTKNGARIAAAGIVSLRPGEEIIAGEKFRLRALSSSTVQIIEDTGKTHRLKVNTGTLLAERRDNTFAVTLSTDFSDFSLAGTRFVLKTSASAEALLLLEGRLLVTVERRQLHLSADAENTLIRHNSFTRTQKMNVAEFARSQPELASQAAILPEFAITAPINAAPERKTSRTGLYARGDCILYYRNNERRRGRIYAREGTGYTIEGAAGREPGIFSESDLLRGNCDDP